MSRDSILRLLVGPMVVTADHILKSGQLRAYPKQLPKPKPNPKPKMVYPKQMPKPKAKPKAVYPKQTPEKKLAKKPEKKPEKNPEDKPMPVLHGSVKNHFEENIVTLIGPMPPSWPPPQMGPMPPSWPPPTRRST